MRLIYQIILFCSLLLSAVVNAGNNTSTMSKKALNYPLSTTWVEEDFFTQQEKYCEVGADYSKSLAENIELESEIHDAGYLRFMNMPDEG